MSESVLIFDNEREYIYNNQSTFQTTPNLFTLVRSLFQWVADLGWMRAAPPTINLQQTHYGFFKLQFQDPPLIFVSSIF